MLETKLKTTSPFSGDQMSELQWPGLHDEDLQEQFPPPVGEKRLNYKQSYKVTYWLVLFLLLISLLMPTDCAMAEKRHHEGAEEGGILQEL